MSKPLFTKEEIRRIEKQLGFLTGKWQEYLIKTVVQMAKNKGIKNLYWNSSETVYPDLNEAKKQYLYERFPSQMGFTEKRIALRDRGIEKLWYLSLSNTKHASSGLIKLDEIPQAYQGAVIKILRYRGPYTKEELKKV